MTNIEKRVGECFANVFPDIQPSQIPNASAATLPAWDSVAHITLLSAISEEFGVELEVEEYEELTSYRAIVDYMETKSKAR
jgi:acyl carrier protein